LHRRIWVKPPDRRRSRIEMFAVLPLIGNPGVLPACVVSQVFGVQEVTRDGGATPGADARRRIHEFGGPCGRGVWYTEVVGLVPGLEVTDGLTDRGGVVQ